MLLYSFLSALKIRNLVNKLYKKKRESLYPVAHPACRGSRIAHRSKIEQRRSPRYMTLHRKHTIYNYIVLLA